MKAQGERTNRLTLVIPVFRNEGSLRPTFNLISDIFVKAEQRPELNFIFVNDGSDDGSLQELLSLKAEKSKVTVLNLSRNFGQAAAIAAGLDIADSDCIVIMSADLQDPPELLLEMYNSFCLGNQVVIAYRENREDAWHQSFTSKLFYKIIRYSIPNMPDGGFDFVLLGRSAYQAFRSYREKNPFFQGNLLSTGFRTQFIPYTRRKREIGKSQYNFWKRLKYCIDGVLASSYILIRMISLCGILFAFAGFAYALVICFARFFGASPFVGWAPIMIIILLVGGLIMLMLGILGEYVWRIYDEVRDRPRYIVSEKYDL